MINIFEKYNTLTDEEKEDIEDLYIVHQLYKQLEEQKELHPTKLELRILFEKIKECLDLSNIKVEEIIKRIVEILKCVDKTIYDIEDLELEELIDLLSNKDSDFKNIEPTKDILFAKKTAKFYCLLIRYNEQYLLVCEKDDGTEYKRIFRSLDDLAYYFVRKFLFEFGEIYV